MENRYNIEGIEIGLEEIVRLIPNDLYALKESIRQSIRKLHEPMQLAIIGKISTSKSTLVNAILGKDEVMATGQMEVTYNVGWLKYGTTNNDIIIHHKDGSPDTHKHPEEFMSWTVDSEAKRELLNNVSYIETFDDAEILREINIIDTPGLDAYRKKDSQNTLDFLKKVRPDAVIMLFTNSIAENTLEVVKDFNSGGNFNPLNAIGVLSKIDLLWMQDDEREKTALQIGQRMASNKLKNMPLLRKTLFNIYPISSLLFLKASTLNEKEFSLIKRLAENDLDMLPCLTLSADDFIDTAYEVSIGIDDRKQLLKNLDIYAVDLLVRFVAENRHATLVDARELLYRESGAYAFMKVLHNHFGSRAKLIKLESIYQTLLQCIKGERVRHAGNNAMDKTINLIEQRISDTFSSLVQEHKEYELLNRIYCNEIDLEEDVVEEFRRLCGEFGSSAPERLAFEVGKCSVQEMIERASERELYWRKEVNNEFDPDEKDWMRTILASYSSLRHKLKVMDYQYNRANAFLFNR